MKELLIALGVVLLLKKLSEGGAGATSVQVLPVGAAVVDVHTSGAPYGASNPWTRTVPGDNRYVLPFDPERGMVAYR